MISVWKRNKAAPLRGAAPATSQPETGNPLLAWSLAVIGPGGARILRAGRSQKLGQLDLLRSAATDIFIAQFDEKAIV